MTSMLQSLFSALLTGRVAAVKNQGHMNIAKFTFPALDNENQLTIPNIVAIKRLIFKRATKLSKTTFHQLFSTAVNTTENTTTWESLPRNLPNIPSPSPNPGDKCRTRPSHFQEVSNNAQQPRTN